MATEFEQLKVSIDAQFAKFESDMQGVAKSVDKAMGQVETRTYAATSQVERNVGLLASRLTGLRGLFGPLTAGALAFGAIRFGENIAVNIDEITKKARQLGIAFDQDSVNAIRHANSEWDKAVVAMEVGLAPLVATWSRILDLVLQYTKAAPGGRTGAFLGFGGTDLPAPTQRQAAATAGIPFGTSEQQLALRQKTASQIGQEPTALADLIDKMKIAAQLAKDTVDQREIDLKLIEAATAALADQRQARSLAHLDALPKVTIGSVDQARGILGAGGISNVIDQIKKQQANETAAALELHKQEARASAANPGEIPIPGLLTAGSLTADIERGTQAQQRDLLRGANEEKYLTDLQEEARISALMPQQREEELELLRARNRFQGDFVDQNEAVIRGLVRQRQAAQEMADVLDRAATDFGDLITNVVEGKESFGKALEAMALDVVNLTIKMEAAKALTGGAGGGGGIFGFLGGLFGGGGVAVDTAGIASVGSDALALGFAANGANASAGQSFIVGEKGPELFQPTVPGTIFPHGTGPGGSTQININVSLDGANGDQTIVRMAHAAVVTAVGQVKQQFPALMADAQMRHF